MLLTADFETTTELTDCRVWAFASSEIGNTGNFKYGNNIDDFMKFCADKKENHKIWFHNLKFDSEFIMYWLYRNGFKHVIDKKDITSKTFTSLISDKGQFYSIEVYFEKKGKKTNKVTFLDSLKILNFKVSKIAKDFNLPISKLEIDYKETREVGHTLSQEEIDYIRNDVEIMSMSLKKMFDMNLTKMTIGSNALEVYKEMIGKKGFEKRFPPPSYDFDIRLSYRGGWTYLNKIFKGKTVGSGIVLDVNSLYPWAMATCPLPYGEGVYFKGEYKKDKLYDLYIQHFTCMFEIKPNHVPTIQMKRDCDFVANEYLESSRTKKGIIKEVDLTLTSVDLKLFFDHYEVYNIEWIDGYKFKSSKIMFKGYVDKWIEEKIKAKNEGNDSMYAISKLLLNSLYGKFALNPQVRSKIPVYDKNNDKIHYVYGEYETREPIYIPVGSFVTAWARDKTIRTAQSVYHRFIYADTDSLHLTGSELPKNIEIDKNKLGAWDFEYEFIKGKFLRQKCYMEKGRKPNSNKPMSVKITCAGMPDSCYNEVNFKNFKIGSSYKGKLQTKHVSGGIVLTDGLFTIKNLA